MRPQAPFLRRRRARRLLRRLDRPRAERRVDSRGWRSTALALRGSSGLRRAGADGEALRALDLSPRPHNRTRELFTTTQIEAHLDAIEAGQQEDGGWTFDWLAWSPAQTTAWRGIVTIRALRWLRENGRTV